MPFEFIKQEIEDVILVKPKVFGDNRGFFMESYKKSDFFENGINVEFNQDNHSKSTAKVLRGLHYQKKHPQAKLVRCSYGAVFDVCVDLRKNSPSYGEWFGIIISSQLGNQLLIPRGCAHGFLVLSDVAIFNYKCDDLYYEDDQWGLRWDDPDINIRWPKVDELIISNKDKLFPYFKELI